MGTGVVDVDQVADVDSGQHPVNGELVVVLAQAADHIVLVVAGGVLLAQHGDVVVSAVHGGAHQVGSTGIQTDVLLVDVLFVDGGCHQRAVGPVVKRPISVKMATSPIPAGTRISSNFRRTPSPMAMMSFSVWSGR